MHVGYVKHLLSSIVTQLCFKQVDITVLFANEQKIRFSMRVLRMVLYLCNRIFGEAVNMDKM
jgi:hypothetical protein